MTYCYHFLSRVVLVFVLFCFLILATLCKCLVSDGSCSSVLRRKQEQNLGNLGYCLEAVLCFLA